MRSAHISRCFVPHSQWEALLENLQHMSVGLTMLRLVLLLTPPTFYFQAQNSPYKLSAPLSARTCMPATCAIS